MSVLTRPDTLGPLQKEHSGLAGAWKIRICFEIRLRTIETVASMSIKRKCAQTFRLLFVRMVAVVEVR